ncbi:MAG: hypothetical protein Q9160_000023 [Pyrenula sp. 1 TL-2023]
MSKTTSSVTAQQRRHKPLEDDISSIGHLRTKSTGKRKSRSDDNPGDGYIDAPSSRKILHLAQDLAEEDAALRKQKQEESRPNPSFDFSSRGQNDAAGTEDEEGDETHWQDEEEEWMPGEEVQVDDVDPADIALFNKFLPQDSKSTFNPPLPSLNTNGHNEGDQASGSLDDKNDDQEADRETTNLADLILARIAEKEALQSQNPHDQHPSPLPPPDAVEIPIKVAETFTNIGTFLSRYKSGPLPKPFKVLPTLPSWPTLLSITRPESWSPNAIYAATRIFVSSPPPTVQLFLNTVLLDRVRDSIHETHRLNVHLYNALKKSLYKPSAFFKGFLFPLLLSGTCTLREAHIVSSVLARVSVPVLHSAAALLRICEIAAEQSSARSTEAAGAANVFIRVLLDKKYALPYRAVDAVVFHFLRFRNSDPLATSPATEEGEGAQDDDVDMSGFGVPSKSKSNRAHNYNNNQSKHSAAAHKLPVLWHQSLLAFAQRYKNDITEDQREALLDLLLVRGHKDIGPEVRRELLAGRGKGRGVAVIDDGQGGAEFDGDDTMMVVG